MSKTITTLVIAFLFTITTTGQSTPEPPKPPTTYSSTHSSSYSVSKTDDDLRIKARFHKSRFNTIKSMLIDNLGEEGLTKSESTFKWSHGSDSFECKLSNTSLRLFLDYESSNSNFISHVEELATNLKYAVSGGNPEDDIKRAEDDVARAKVELDRAKARLEKSKN